MLATVVSLAALNGILAWCAVASPSPFRVIPHQVPLTQLEKTLRRAPAIFDASAAFRAGIAVRNVTPDPLLHVQDDDLNVRVSFIVGSDGHVHSAFVLDSGGSAEDQIVLRAVRFWRYRPALCNGVPTDSEARVRFSIR